MNKIKLLAVLLVIISLISCRNQKTQKPLIVSSLPIWTNIAEYIGGRDFRYYSILKGGESPHGYEPKPSDIAKIKEADLIIIHGLGLDNWAIKGADERKVFNIGKLLSKKYEFLTEKKGYHIWANPLLMEDIYFEIAKKLSSFYPKRAKYYEKRADDYAAMIEQMVDKISTCISQVKNRKVIAFHPVWEPFFKTVGLECVAYFVKTPEEEVTPKRMKELIDIGRKENVKLVVGESVSPVSFPKKLSEELGAKLLILDPIPDEDYVKAISSWGRKLCDSLKE